jgi:hypothetical protein
MDFILCGYQASFPQNIKARNSTALKKQSLGISSYAEMQGSYPQT